MDTEREEEPDEYDNMELVNYYKTNMDNLNIDAIFKDLELLREMEIHTDEMDGLYNGD